MNEWNNFETLEHFRGIIWVSKLFKKENRGNICVFHKGTFRTLAYIAPETLENKDLKTVVYDTLQANGTLWMLE